MCLVKCALWGFVNDRSNDRMLQNNTVDHTVVATLKACLQESGEPQGIEVTRLAVVEK